MKLTIEYNGSNKVNDLKMELKADITEDAIALGYITRVLFKTASVLSVYLQKTNPKYHDQISQGISYSVAEEERENNSVYPFTTFILEDEKPTQ